MNVYRVETPRLRLRPWTPETDTEAVKRAEDESREHLRRFMLWAARDPETLDETSQKLRLFRSRFDADEDFFFGVFDRATDTIRGGAGIHPRVGTGGMEIGYWVHALHVRTGIATEVAAALTRVCFEALGMRWVEIRCASDNEPSARVPRRLGFTHEATLKSRLTLGDGSFADVLIFSMFRDAYDASPAKSVETAAWDAAGRRLM